MQCRAEKTDEILLDCCELVDWCIVKVPVANLIECHHRPHQQVYQRKQSKFSLNLGYVV